MTPDRLAEIEARYPRAGSYTEAQVTAMGWRALDDVPALLAEVRRLQAAVERARSIIRDDCDQIADRYGDDWDHLPGCQAHEPGDLAGLCPLCRITAALDGDDQ